MVKEREDKVKEHHYCGCNYCKYWANMDLSVYDKRRLGYP